ncbi:terminase [Pasteurellaceae bacterium Orientalotternb1]|nr:terminase [Pasteurellaceae bacterium Orientalotternb1]
MRGRKAKPTQQKLLSGNPGKRKLNLLEPVYDRLSLDTPPSPLLNEDGQRMWIFVLRELVPQGILYITDMQAVTNYCIAYQNLCRATRDIEKYDSLQIDQNGKLSRNPALVTQKEAEAMMRSIGSSLGLDPSSRQRLIGKADDAHNNPFAELLQ